jgi:cobalt/nickel transport system ATP-binding protein
MTPVVEFESVSFQYPDGTPALDGVTFSVERGEHVALLGATGSGKSTLLQHLNGLLIADAGVVRMDGEKVTPTSARAVRRRVGLVFQDPNDQLFLPTLLEDVTFGPLNDGKRRAEAEALADQTLQELGLGAARNRAAHHLSGGERRLAALATVLVSRPEVLGLDEPTGDLDARSRTRLVRLLRRRDETLLVATHDIGAARALCHRGVVLDEGAVVADAHLEDILTDEKLLQRCGLATTLDD